MPFNQKVEQQGANERPRGLTLDAGVDCAVAQGCAFPLQKADLMAGEIVLDLGCGGGIETIEAASQVGATGFVYGLDMSPEVLELARHNAQEAGVENVRFFEGFIEEIPLDDDSVDVVITNCVINLSSDRGAALAEAYRVLRPGGRLVIADIILLDSAPSVDKEILPGRQNPPIEDQDNISITLAQDLIAPVLGCVNGVLLQTEYLQLLKQCGFSGIEVEVYLRYTTDRIRSRAEKRNAFEALLALRDPVIAKNVNGAFASVYLSARK